MFILTLSVFFTTRFLKVAPIRVRFSPGFPPGAGFHREEFAQACWSRAGAAKNRRLFHGGSSSVFAVRRGVLRRTSSATLEPRRTDFPPRGQF
jgi:hypothetical protein